MRGKISHNKKTLIKAASLAIIIASAALLINNEKAERRWWVRPWLNRRKGNLDIVEEFVDCDDRCSLTNFLRMDEDTFNKLLSKIQHRITKKSISRESISAKHKLIITLRYLATGESFRSLMFNYRISVSAISLFIPVVCRAIYEELKGDYLKVPSSTAEWLEIARDFERMWNIPNAVGALDGKHIVIKSPINQGSAYYNYKENHSIVLLALVDANYNFTYINVGTNGRVSDGGVYLESNLYSAVEQNLINLPEDKPLPGRQRQIPHVILADSAFALAPHLMKPYPFRGITRQQRIFNYRLSRGRRVVENVFGILANRIRVLINIIPLQPEKAKIVTQACCVLHNFLRKESHIRYMAANPEDDVDNRYRFLYGLSRQNRRPTNEAIGIREEYTEYFNSCGTVPWQDNFI